MSGICEVANDLYAREHVKDLRADIENQLKAAHDKMDDTRKVDLKEKEGIDNKINTTNQVATDFRKVYDNFVHEATYLNE